MYFDFVIDFVIRELIVAPTYSTYLLSHTMYPYIISYYLDILSESVTL